MSKFETALRRIESYLKKNEDLNSEELIRALDVYREHSDFIECFSGEIDDETFYDLGCWYL